MKFVKGLSEAEQHTLLDASRYAPWSRFRQRAHAVPLNGKRYSLAQLADIFEVDRARCLVGWVMAPICRRNNANHQEAHDVTDYIVGFCNSQRLSVVQRL